MFINFWQKLMYAFRKNKKLFFKKYQKYNLAQVFLKMYENIDF